MADSAVTPRGRYPERVVSALIAAWSAHPSQRMTQVIVNALGVDPFYIEDEDAIELLHEYARAR